MQIMTDFKENILQILKTVLMNQMFQTMPDSEGVFSVFSI